jgi:hypothetical protein
MIKLDVILALIGMWIITDGLISIRLYLNTVNETGKRLQNWKYDHSIRLLRVLCGLLVIGIGYIL